VGSYGQMIQTDWWDQPPYQVVLQIRYVDGPGDYDVQRSVVIADGANYYSLEKTYEDCLKLIRAGL
jgi:hypothetical protein